MAAIEVFQRTDNKWAWRLWSDNWKVVATDGSQGYENVSDAREMSNRIVNGEFADATRITTSKRSA